MIANLGATDHASEALGTPEIAAHKATGMQLNWIARYQPIVERLSQIQGPVLEVGSGATGIGLFTERPFVGCDLSFKRQPVPTMSAVVGSALRLPFGDRRFKAVIASDVLEHIPTHERAVALEELIRASQRWAFVGVPCGEASRWADRCLARWRAFWNKPAPPWLVEHQALGLPTCESVEQLLQEQEDIAWNALPNEHAAVHLAFTIIDTTRVLKPISFLWRWRPGLLTWLARVGAGGAPYRRIYIIERTHG